MGKDENKSVVVALYSGADKADMAANQLKDWDWADESVSLGAIQILTSVDGKVESRGVAPRHTGGGAKWGAIVGVVAGIFSGGLTLLAGAAYGALAGGALGSLKKAGLKISDEDLQKVDSWLKDGKAGLVVMCDEEELAPTSDLLKSTGAVQVMTFAMSAEALSMLGAAAEKAQETAGDVAVQAGDAVDTASDAATDAVAAASDAAHDAVDATADAAQGAVDATADAAKSATDAAADAVS